MKKLSFTVTDNQKELMDQLQGIIDLDTNEEPKELFLQMIWKMYRYKSFRVEGTPKDMFKAISGTELIFEALVKALEEHKIRSISEILFERVHEQKDEYEEKIGAYPYIPFHEADFVYFVKEVVKKCFKREEKISFIDVGSGYGVKSNIFGYLFPKAQAYGIEYNKFTHCIGAQNFSIYKNVHCKRGDAFEEDYSKYNFIYLYCPMNKPESMRRLYNRIWDTMPVGGIILEVLKNSGFGSFVYSDKKFDQDVKYRDIIVKTKEGMKRIPLSPPPHCEW